MSPSSRRLHALAVMATALVLACGDKGTGPDDIAAGTGGGTISGSISRQFLGQAVYGTPVAGADLFTLVLDGGAAGVEIAVVRTGGGRPGTGTYAIGGPQSGLHAELTVAMPDEEDFLFTTLSGQLQITSSASGSLRGNLSFRARRDGGSAEVDVVASFHAACVPTSAFHCN